MSSVIQFSGTVLILLLSLFACESPTRTVEQGDVVNLYSNQLSATDQDLFAAFESASGLKVNIISRPGGKILERINTLGDDSTNADVLVLKGGEYLYQAQQAGILDTLPSSSFLDAVPNHLQDDDQQWLGLAYSAYAIAYRRDSVDTLQVQRYQQLADERWQNRLEMAEEQEAYHSLLASLMADEGRELTQSWWNSLLKNRDTNPDSLTLLQLTNSANYRNLPDWGLLFPQPEAYLQLTGAALREGAPQPKRAEALFNYLFSREFLRKYAERYRLFPARTDVEPPSSLYSPATFRKDTTAQSRIARLANNLPPLPQVQETVTP